MVIQGVHSHSDSLAEQLAHLTAMLKALLYDIVAKDVLHEGYHVGLNFFKQLHQLLL